MKEPFKRSIDLWKALFEGKKITDSPPEYGIYYAIDNGVVMEYRPGKPPVETPTCFYAYGNYWEQE
jgi:hypothetical protein